MLINNIFQSERETGGRHPALYTEVRSKELGVALPAMASEIQRAAVAIQTMGPSSRTRPNFIKMART